MKATGVDQVVAHAGAVLKALQGVHDAAAGTVASAATPPPSQPAGKVGGHD